MTQPALPHLIERALRLLAERGQPVSTADLARHLFGAVSGPWERLLPTVLTDPRLQRLPDGRWTLAEAVAPPVRWVALALATSGPKPERHHIVGIAALRGRGTTVEARFAHLVRPPRPVRLPAYLARQGITPAALATAPTFAAIAPALVDFLGEALLVGLDIGLQAAFLQAELRRAGLPPLTNPLADLAALAPPVGGKPRLAQLTALAGVAPPADETLSAQAEAIARLLQRHPPTTPASSALQATRRRPLLQPALARAIPPGPGLYIFTDAAGTVLYIGQSRNLRQRVLSYLTRNLAVARRLHGLADQVADIQVESTSCALEAALREAAAIATLQPPFNTVRRPTPRTAYLVLRLTRRGQPRLVVQRAPATGTVLAGPLPVPVARHLAQRLTQADRAALAATGLARLTTPEAGRALLLELAGDLPVAGPVPLAALTGLLLLVREGQTTAALLLDWQGLWGGTPVRSPDQAAAALARLGPPALAPAARAAQFSRLYRWLSRTGSPRWAAVGPLPAPVERLAQALRRLLD